MKKILLEATFLSNSTYDGIPTYVSSILNNLPSEYADNITILNLFTSSYNRNKITKTYKEYQLGLRLGSQWVGLGGKYIPSDLEYDTFIGGAFVIPPFIPKNKEKIVITYDTIPFKDDYLLEFVDLKNIKVVNQNFNDIVLNNLISYKSLDISDKIITISNTV